VEMERPAQQVGDHNMAAGQAEHQPVVKHGGATGSLLLLCPLPDFSLKNVRQFI
jgi:hypothetical protein